MKKRIISHNKKETSLIAKKLAKEVEHKKHTIIGLTGELGSGKTIFTKAFLKEIGVKRKTISPTFIITRTITQKIRGKHKKIYHIDAYRINNKKDLIGSGIKDAIKNNNSITIIEWADNIKYILPKKTIWINIEYTENENERNITIN